ncbi:hypothetical protein EXIGLDRAFT_768140 [Exidia glandulosa HHB12029]|uniref:Cyclin-D1-binding protein 1-like N-terminal domain-containing protein n=1 Tax=Exidia glandulosa HHB12029 TaxID=1314781 RepID=A0A165IGF2_EXIGL|nr:hypothetical protein EXIGLDRAFT_768140 [Exidia glandulosa HHB12029]
MASSAPPNAHAQVAAALAAAAQTASAGLDALAASSDPQISPDDEHEPAVLRKDLISIMTLLYNAVTKIALALRPGQSNGPEYAASLQPTKDLGSATVALAACASLFSSASHGPALRTHARNLASDVLRAVQQLASSLDDQDEDLYVRTGAVHDAIDRARAQMPASELDAVRDVFKANQACLDDGIPEVQELMEEDGTSDEPDGWDELAEEFGDDFAPSKLTPEERQRVKDVSYYSVHSTALASDVSKMYPLLKIVVQLHKKVMTDHLVAKADAASALPIAHLAALQPLSTQILMRFEDLVSALYGPQDTAAVDTALSAMLETARSLKPLLIPSDGQDLAAKVEQLDLNGTASVPAVESKSTRWFRLCFIQIDKIAQTLRPT